MCTTCKSLPETRHELIRTGFLDNDLAQCMICTQRPYVPGLYDYPSSLTHSSETQVWTLWPLKLSESPNERGQSGFRQFSEISKLKWSPKPVLQNMKELEPGGKNPSVKRAYLAKVCSPVTVYAVQFDLIQLHFDRHVVTKFKGVHPKFTTRCSLKQIGDD